jgi:quinol---cytochrome c reductase cytochrome c subunit, bacillus type
MVLLLLLPFYDRNPERNPLKRPIASIAGVMTIIAMAFLTFLGANAGSPTEIDIAVAPEYEAGKLVAAQSGCLACHQFGENGNNGPGPKLTEIGARLNPAAIARSLEIGPGIMPSYRAMAEDEPEKFRDLVAFLGSLNGEEQAAAEASSTSTDKTVESAGGEPATVVGGSDSSGSTSDSGSTP